MGWNGLTVNFQFNPFIPRKAIRGGLNFLLTATKAGLRRLSSFEGRRYSIIFGVSVLILLLKSSKGEEVEVRKPVCREKEKCLALLDIAEDLVTNTKALCSKCKYTNDASKQSECTRKEKSSTYMEFTRKLLREIRENFPSCQPVECGKRPRDCSEVKAGGDIKSGTFAVFPMSKYTASKLVNVYCDMDTDGGGWTVIQRRGNFTPQQDFQQNWKAYKTGFGNIERDFYLGNDNIYALSNQSPVELRIDLMDDKGNRRYATYRSFRIDDEKNSYALHVSGYDGDAGDGMQRHDGQQFSTIDKGNTEAVKFLKGAWWISDWADSHLNGRYEPGIDDPENIHWHVWLENIGLAFVEMKVREV
ncbi:Techylectin-5A [Araneus ventricosus]|uniref:Techylectin-5A n=1 Tax=Araneus ventricosus TaxID=182803 RepID=A0A4Y2E071_ARAVE|nr:Techylectin-5A [Araneus ventricosus]